MKTIIIFSLILAFVVGIGFLLYLLAPTFPHTRQTIRHVKVRNSEPQIRHKAQNDWKQLQHEIKNVHSQSKPATIHTTVRQNLHLEEMGDSLRG